MRHALRPQVGLDAERRFGPHRPRRRRRAIGRAGRVIALKEPPDRTHALDAFKLARRVGREQVAQVRAALVLSIEIGPVR